MQGDNNRDVTVIVRYAGERTVTKCLELIAEQVASQQIHLIEERPFYNAVKKTFEIGITEGRKWTLAIDADLYISTRCIQEMTAKATLLGDRLYIYQGYVMDFLFGKPREGGPHLYQTRHLEKALAVLSSNPYQYRPESETYIRLAEKDGLIKYVDNVIYGLHDYHQYRIDIFRKAFFHAKKHIGFAGVFLDYWINLAKKDEDFKVAIYGFVEGIIASEEIEVDIEYLRKIAISNMDRLAIEEKPKSLGTESIHAFLQEEIMKGTKYPISKKVLPEVPLSLWQRLKRKTIYLLNKLIQSIESN